MNNVTTGGAPLRLSENAVILAHQIDGVISRKGAGQFELTKLGVAIAKVQQGELLTEEEKGLLNTWASDQQ